MPILIALYITCMIVVAKRTFLMYSFRGRVIKESRPTLCRLAYSSEYIENVSCLNFIVTLYLIILINVFKKINI